MSKNYAKAQIYLTKCIHPDYNHLMYVGLDCKCDPNYLGSSVALKWWINYLGRSFFKKEILEEITGTMSELCSVEQKYILKYDAVRNPNFFNMNGGTKAVSIEDMAINMDYVIRPTATLSQLFVNKCINTIKDSSGFLGFNKRQLISRILCMMLYGYLKYDQEDFEYNQYTHYGNCDPEDLQDILSAMSEYNIANSGMGTISLLQDFLDEIPVDLTHEHFSVQLIN